MAKIEMPVSQIRRYLERGPIVLEHRKLFFPPDPQLCILKTLSG